MRWDVGHALVRGQLRAAVRVSSTALIRARRTRIDLNTIDDAGRAVGDGLVALSPAAPSGRTPRSNRVRSSSLVPFQPLRSPSRSSPAMSAARSRPSRRTSTRPGPLGALLVLGGVAVGPDGTVYVTNRPPSCRAAKRSHWPTGEPAPMTFDGPGGDSRRARSPSRPCPTAFETLIGKKLSTNQSMRSYGSAPK